MEMKNLFSPFNQEWIKEIREKTNKDFDEEEWKKFAHDFGYEVSLFLQNFLLSGQISVKHTKSDYIFKLSVLKK